MEKRVYSLSSCGCFFYAVGLVLILPIYKSRGSTLKGEGRLPKVTQEIIDGVRQK